ncbi:beta-1,3-galactosyltransferase brn [Fopius arisanus]|uniref:Hexosyltransferase n=1 Tax=Fopius arisanus TaxID=64838 RepID=A0A9R1TZV3_9HYME|nr:PREDICTED: beta-1,3-galactosyltransferase brn [Fopius arisanus]
MIPPPDPCSQQCLRMISRIKLKHVLLLLVTLFLLDVFGAFTHVFELSYDKYFKYPYEGDIHGFIDSIKHRKKPNVDPINDYNFSYIHDCKDFCNTQNDFRSLRIVFLVKSSAEHFQRRVAIRSTWGFKKRFFDVPTRTIFLLGLHKGDDELQKKIDEEAETYKDILQANFIDSYYNNTIKTMIGFKWAYNHCRNSKFYFFVDDDIYVSVKNVLRFIRNPAYYPEYLKDPNRLVKREVEEVPKDLVRNPRANAREKILMRRREGWTRHNKTRMPSGDGLKGVDDLEDKFNNSTVYKKLTRGRRQVFDFELPDDVKLFAGYVFVSSPHRHKTSKWYVSLEEYPFHLWPPYVTAGAYVLSKAAMIEMYLTSLYTQHFRFDDIFLGLVAKKADIEPFHCDEFHFYKKDYTKFNYKYVISSHGYGNPEELMEIWNEQKGMGNA